MIRVRSLFVLGLVFAGAGCASLHRAVPPVEPKVDPPAELSETVATPRRIDPFHPPSNPPGSQMARWFPHLTKLLSPPPPKITETRKTEKNAKFSIGRPTNSPAEPRELPDAALTSRRGTKPSPRSDEALDLTAAPPPPTLPVTLVAESEPDAPSGGSRPARSPATPRPMPSPSFNSFPSMVGLSVRRMPPMPAVNPSPGVAPPARRAIEHDEDSQARLARAEEDKPPLEPLLAVSRLQPPAGSPRPDVDRSEPKEEDSVVRANDEEASPPPADPFADIPAQTKPSRKIQGPPSLEDEMPQVRRVSTRPDRPNPPLQARRDHDRDRDRSRNQDPDTGGDPVLLGRPRLNQGQMSLNRNDLQPDVPLAMFPRTYYAKGTPAKRPDAAKLDPETQQTSHWKWRPRLLHRFWDEEPATSKN